MYWKFVETLSKKDDKYGFVNEVEIRVATGVSFVLAFFAFFLVVLKGEFMISFALIGLIWFDFVLKVFISPKISIFWNLVKLFTKNKAPIWVGAVQKRFAWSIGLFLSSFVMFCMLVLGKYLEVSVPEVLQMLGTIEANIKNAEFIVTPFNPAILACGLCLVFMWLESVAWYCVGCKLYLWLVKKWWFKGYAGQNCVNGECEI